MKQESLAFLKEIINQQKLTETNLMTYILNKVFKTTVLKIKGLKDDVKKVKKMVYNKIDISVKRKPQKKGKKNLQLKSTITEVKIF